MYVHQFNLYDYIFLPVVQPVLQLQFTKLHGRLSIAVMSISFSSGWLLQCLPP